MPAQEQPEPSTLKTDQSATQATQKPLKVLLTWQSPERAFKPRSREYFTTIGAIVALLVLILLFLKEWLLIVVILALGFVSYVMATIEPQSVKHQLTNRGIVTGGRNYFWPDLGRFWFSQKWDQKILHVETQLPFPRQLIMLLGDTDQAQIKKVLSEYLLFEEPEKTWVDNAGEWLSRRVPLEKS